MIKTFLEHNEHDLDLVVNQFILEFKPRVISIVPIMQDSYIGLIMHYVDTQA
jgi:hypothetical protein